MPLREVPEPADRRLRRLVLVPAVMLGLSFTSQASAQHGRFSAPLASLGSWTAFCDEDGGCGLANASMRREPRASDPDGANAWVCVWLGPLGDADAVLSIRLETPAPAAAGPEAIVIESDAGPLGTAQRMEDGRHEITGAAAAEIAQQLREGRELLLREADGGPVRERLSLRGFREGLAYALGKRAAPAPQHHALCRCLPAQGACAPCRCHIETSAGSVRPRQLASIVDHDTVGPGFTNLVVDPSRGRIEDLFKIRGGNDCGTRRAWVWNGGRFVLASEHTMPDCFGARHGQWLRMSATPVRGEPRPGRRPC
ncbi:MAG: DUF1176 domain-containing protein [Alphaproteobacteria bacterium]|nr:DUF1176 domain-containing protein [Alphaproteobacteria bacterium]